MSERRILQIAIAVTSLVPVCAGAAGIALGPAMVDVGSAPIGADSHFRYLSGLLLGVGLGFATTIPRIEHRTTRFRMLAAIVVIGGLGRLWSLIARGVPDKPMLAALVMELGVTPVLALWQSRVAAQGRQSSVSSGHRRRR